MTGFTVDEGAVHLNPMAGDVKSNHQLEPKHQPRIEETESHDKTCSCTPRGGNITHSELPLMVEEYC